MESRSNRRQQKKRHWLRRTLITLVVLVVILGGGGLYAYYRLMPSHHFDSASAFSPSGSKNAVTSKGTINLLVLGSDQRPGDKLGHSDSIMLLHIDFNTNKISAVSIPRDTRVHLDGYGYTKLTSVQYVEEAKKGTKAGVESAVKAVSDLTGVPINYYAETSYTGLESMVNVLGTVQINVPFDVTLTKSWYKDDRNMVIHKGVQNLNGKMITELVHERDSLPGTDFGRQQLQEKAIVAIAKTALKPQNISRIPSLINQTSKFLIATNMTHSDMVSFGLAFKKLDVSHIKYYQLKSTSQSMYDDVLKNNNSEVVLDPTDLKTVMANFK